MMTDNKGYYGALGLTPMASSYDIEKAFKDAVEKLKMNSRKDPYVADKYAVLKEAYGVLSNPVKKGIYDRDNGSLNLYDEIPQSTYSSPLSNLYSAQNMGQRARGALGGAIAGTRDLRALIFLTCAFLFILYVAAAGSKSNDLVGKCDTILNKFGTSIFSSTEPKGFLHMAGGYIVQCLVPLLLLMIFRSAKCPARMTAACIWLGENVLRVRLFSAVDPNWDAILTTLGMLSSKAELNTGMLCLGWLLMGGAFSWYLRHWLLCRNAM